MDGGPDEPSAVSRLWFTALAENGGEGRWGGRAAFLDGKAFVGTRGGIAAVELATGRRAWTASLWATATVRTQETSSPGAERSVWLTSRQSAALIP